MLAIMPQPISQKSYIFFGQMKYILSWNYGSPVMDAIARTITEYQTCTGVAVCLAFSS